MLVFAGLLRQVHEWARFHFQILYRIIDFSAIEFIETCDEPLDEIKLFAWRSEFANQQFTDSLPSGDVAADVEGVLFIETVLLPLIRLFAGNVGSPASRKGHCCRDSSW